MSKNNNNNAATEALLGHLHNAVATDLIKVIESGEATSSEVSNAIRFLKDNGIEASTDLNDKLSRLKDSLPDFDEDEEASSLPH